VSVLVLEAGAPNLNDPEIRMVLNFNPSILTHAVYAVIPAVFGSQLGKPQYDWGFFSVSASYSIPPHSNFRARCPK
jgi:hypothetical protein